MVSVRWTGAAGLEFTHDGKSWLIDPYISRSGKAAIFLGRLEADREKVARYLDSLPGTLQAVLVSHTHFDHALDIPEIIGRFPVPLIGSESCETLMALHGMQGRVTVCREKCRLELPGGASVAMIPSLHGLVVFGRAPYPGEVKPGQKPPLRASDYRHGQVFSIRLLIGGTSFLHVGTANLIDAELEGEACDVLFCCMPGWKAVPDFHHRVLSRVRPKIVVPFHFDDFSAPLPEGGRTPSTSRSGEEEFLERVAAEAPGARIVRPDLFRPMTF